ncbi:MAG: uroporphyrinogen decarboxylase [Pirellulales bacterium]|nr:uroporphyrinogen decarboxylase [Pirellulales bacterium]
MTNPLPPWHDSPFMKAARREPADRVPIWLMRQAGRYQASYRTIRRTVSFLDLCKTPDLAAEVALDAVDQLGVDAAIVFSDLLLVLEPLGFELDYPAGGGPVLANPIREGADVDRAPESDDIEPLRPVIEAVRRTRAGLDDRIPLLGFAGAPFTLASYAIEGGSARDPRQTRRFMWTDPGAWNALLGRLARAAARLLNAQIDAGAQAVQVFDSWAGFLAPDDYRRFALPHTQSLIQAIRPGVPVIHFATGNPALLPPLAEAGGTILGLDWRVRLDEGWRLVGPDRAVQGNLDPAVLLTHPEVIRRQAREILEQAAGRRGHIFNLGHGVLPDTPLENAVALVEAVHEWPTAC